MQRIGIDTGVSHFLRTYANVSDNDAFLNYPETVTPLYNEFLKNHTSSIIQAYAIDPNNHDGYSCIGNNDLFLYPNATSDLQEQQSIADICCEKKEDSKELLKRLSNLWKERIADFRKTFKNLYANAIRTFYPCDQSVINFERFQSNLNQSIEDIRIKSDQYTFNPLYDNRKESLERLGILPLTETELSKILSIHYKIDLPIVKTIIRGVSCFREMRHAEQKNEDDADFVEQLKNDLDQYRKTFDRLKNEKAEMCHQLNNIKKTSNQKKIDIFNQKFGNTSQTVTHVNTQFDPCASKIERLRAEINRQQKEIVEKKRFTEGIKKRAPTIHLFIFGASLEAEKLAHQIESKTIECQKNLNLSSLSLNTCQSIESALGDKVEIQNKFNRARTFLARCRNDRNKAQEDLAKIYALLTHLHAGLKKIIKKNSL